MHFALWFTQKHQKRTRKKELLENSLLRETENRSQFIL